MAITVVTGPPCSGKSTYVRTHSKPGDIVIDFDTMAQAFGSPVPHDHTAATRHVTIHARKAAIAAALTITAADVWIVDCNIPQDRMVAYCQHGARIVAMDEDVDELHRRAGRERPPLWHRLIDDWRPPEGLDVEHAGAAPSRAW